MNISEGIQLNLITDLARYLMPMNRKNPFRHSAHHEPYQRDAEEINQELNARRGFLVKEVAYDGGQRSEDKHLKCPKRT